ncbi:MAG: fatty acid desaturase-domain-containing protein [Monoraphidium minutum]|nr:MAG: fatty acid desaturase-domain-containing protein [Monoraphidium minutum]
MGQACSYRHDASRAPTKTGGEAALAHQGAPGQIGGAPASAEAPAPTKARVTFDSEERPRAKTVSIAPVAAFLDSTGYEGEQSIKSGNGCSAPATPGDALKQPAAAASSAAPQHDHTTPSPLPAAAAPGPPDDLAEGGAAGSGPAAPQLERGGSPAEREESVAGLSRGATTVKSQMSSASERSNLTGAVDACNSEVSAAALERLPSAPQSQASGGGSHKGGDDAGRKSGGSSPAGGGRGSHSHSGSGSDSDEELPMDEASKASLHVVGTAAPVARGEGGDGEGGEDGEEEARGRQIHSAQSAFPAGRAPASPPPFTVGQLRRAIPAHCFERSLLRSSAYLAVDLAAAAALYYASTFIHLAPAWLAWGLLWPLYWFWQGAVCTGLWVIAHECGHQSFSKWQVVNDGVGLVVHSALLVPYYSWKHSHRRHHSNTGSMTRDEQLLGWPSYLFFNATGREYSRFACHFDPWSPIFSKRERAEVAISDAALAVALYGLYNLALAFGWPWLVKAYVMPYLVVNFWLVAITFLQHTHPGLPHYDDADWEWLRGALATVDRSYGVLDYFFHHIADTHEATAALKTVLGPYYCRDGRNVMKALWEESATCHYVAPDAPGGGALWFRSVCDAGSAGKDE